MEIYVYENEHFIVKVVADSDEDANERIGTVFDSDYMVKLRRTMEIKAGVPVPMIEVVSKYTCSKGECDD